MGLFDDLFDPDQMQHLTQRAALSREDHENRMFAIFEKLDNEELGTLWGAFAHAATDSSQGWIAVGMIRTIIRNRPITPQTITQNEP